MLSTTKDFFLRKSVILLDTEFCVKGLITFEVLQGCVIDPNSLVDTECRVLNLIFNATNHKENTCL